MQVLNVLLIVLHSIVLNWIHQKECTVYDIEVMAIPIVYIGGRMVNDCWIRGHFQNTTPCIHNDKSFAGTFFVSLKTNNIVNIQLVETCSVVAMKIRLQQMPEPHMTCWGPGPQHCPYLRLLYWPNNNRETYFLDSLVLITKE